MMAWQAVSVLACTAAVAARAQSAAANLRGLRGDASSSDSGCITDSAPWQAFCPSSTPCLRRSCSAGVCHCECLEKEEFYTELWHWYECPSETSEAPGPLWRQEWEVLGSGANTACRGANSSDLGGNATHSHDYELHTSVISLEACESLFWATGPDRVGLEYNQDLRRCEIWTRPAGIGAWATPSLPGFTCKRYGWPAKYLHPMDGGEDRACRGADPEDNSGSYYDQYDAESLEACKGRCVASPVCAGLEFNPTSGRCEIWKRVINATAPRSGFTCLRYDPSLPQPSSTTFTTSPSATVISRVDIGYSWYEPRKCVDVPGVVACPRTIHFDYYRSGSIIYEELDVKVTVEGDQVCVTKVSGGHYDGGWLRRISMDCQVKRLP